MFDNIRNKYRYKSYIPLVYDKKLKAAYTTPAIMGGTQDKCVLITGATGGIGIALCSRFLAEGCEVILAGRNIEKLKKAEEILRDAYPKGIMRCIVLDLEDPNSITNVDNCNVDILINNAGVFTEVDTKRRFRSVQREQYHTIWKTNFEGTYAVSKCVIQSMLRRKCAGHIINIASICAFDKKYQYTPYGMSKAAIVKMTQQLSQCYKKDNLCICGIAPGSVATGMGNLGVGSNVAGGTNRLHHVALPEEIAALAAYLAGPLGKYHNGQTIVASACEIL